MNILIRADSSSDIGTGHIMRDLVLAGQYPNDNIIFASMNLQGNINSKISDAGYEVKILNSIDISELDVIIKDYKIDLLVIDNYEIDFDYETQIKFMNPNLKIMVLDDTYERHNCDILLNHNCYADESKYKGLVPEHCELRCGKKFTLLREEFILEKRTKREKVSDKFIIFLAMGGADSSNLNVKILETLSELREKIRVIVVTTDANKHFTKLSEFVKDRDWIDLQINSDKIAYLMNISDLAIVTPSVILNEVMFMDLPFIAIKTAGNQNEMVDYLIKNNFRQIKNFDENKFKEYFVEILSL